MKIWLFGGKLEGHLYIWEKTLLQQYYAWLKPTLVATCMTRRKRPIFPTESPSSICRMTRAIFQKHGGHYCCGKKLANRSGQCTAVEDPKQKHGNNLNKKG